MQTDSVAIRLKLFMEREDLTSSQFADECRISRPTLSQILTGRNKKISDVLIGQIHQAFPRLNVVWLLFGEGEMYIGGSSSSDIDSPHNVKEMLISPSHKSVQSLWSDIEMNGEKRSETESDELKFPANDESNKKNSTLTPLSPTLNDTENIKDEHVEALNTIKDLMSQIDTIRKNPRRVVQIMVYYDDSTFETFIPG